MLRDWPAATVAITRTAVGNDAPKDRERMLMQQRGVEDRRARIGAAACAHPRKSLSLLRFGTLDRRTGANEVAVAERVINRGSRWASISTAADVRGEAALLARVRGSTRWRASPRSCAARSSARCPPCPPCLAPERPLPLLDADHRIDETIELGLALASVGSTISVSATGKLTGRETVVHQTLREVAHYPRLLRV